jgi:hypothetical protein
MTAALGTLSFLATLWLLVVVGAAVLEESGAKIAAAIKGEPAQRRARPIVCSRPSSRTAANEPRCASASLRAAA